MFILNKNASYIKPGDIVAFDPGDHLGTRNKEKTLVKVTRIKTEDIYYKNNASEKIQECIIAYFNIITSINKGCKIDLSKEYFCNVNWLFRLDDIKLLIHEGISNSRIATIIKDFNDAQSK